MSNATASVGSRWVALAVPVVLLLAGCSSSASPAAPSTSGAASAGTSAASGAASAGTSTASGAAAAVTAKESEFKIELGASTAAAGPVTFQITNAGSIVHEFVVMKTDLAADKLPIDTSKGVVSEDAGGLTAVDEVEDIAVGSTPSLSVDLPAGHYVVICNLPGHYAGGMRAEFTTT